MMTVMFDFLIIFQFLVVVSTMIVNQEFVRFTYMVNSTLLHSTTCPSKLTCLQFCAEEDSCSMVTISLKDPTNAREAYVCHRYHVIGHDKISNQHEMEIWYKDNGQEESTDHKPACPSGFTELDVGCYHDGSQQSDWSQSKEYCENMTPGSHLANFQRIEVGALHIITGYVEKQQTIGFFCFLLSTQNTCILLQSG